MQRAEVDYTIFWRELARIVQFKFCDKSSSINASISDDEWTRILEILSKCSLATANNCKRKSESITEHRMKFISELKGRQLMQSYFQLLIDTHLWKPKTSEASSSTSMSTLQPVAQTKLQPAAVVSCMQKVNPKFVPREWMLVEVYKQASDTTNPNYSGVLALEKLFSNPYDEQSDEVTTKYYRAKIGGAGTEFMT
jgi:uncharacterized protein YdiU (UPF0061 family)